MVKVLATQSAEPPAHPDPILLFVMRLLAPFPVTDDRCLLTQRAPARHLPQIDPRQPWDRLIIRQPQCDKENHGRCEGLSPALPCQVSSDGGLHPPVQSK